MAFSAAHATLGECVGVAVHGDGVLPTVQALRQQLQSQSQLGTAALPAIVVHVPELPRTATHKLRRSGFAARLALPEVSAGQFMTLVDNGVSVAALAPKDVDKPPAYVASTELTIDHVCSLAATAAGLTEPVATDTSLEQVSST